MLLGALYYDHYELALPVTPSKLVALQLYGTWVAAVVASVFITYFVQRVSRTLAAQDRALVEARAHRTRMEHFVALSTLAAGAAHELSTPLSTIAIAAREVERSLERGLSSEDALEDVALIREEVTRCHGILKKLSLNAANDDAVPERITVQGLLDRTFETAHDREEVEIVCETPDAEVCLAPELIVRIVRTLVKNALDASESGQPVEVDAAKRGQSLFVVVTDHGKGMGPETLQRVGQPFFTTKGPGAGMGLGIFLTSALVDHVGGTLSYDSTLGEGTTVVVEFPMQPCARSAQAPTP